MHWGIIVGIASVVVIIIVVIIIVSTSGSSNSGSGSGNTVMPSNDMFISQINNNVTRYLAEDPMTNNNAVITSLTPTPVRIMDSMDGKKQIMFPNGKCLSVQGGFGSNSLSVSEPCDIDPSMIITNKFDIDNGVISFVNTNNNKRCLQGGTDNTFFGICTEPQNMWTIEGP